MRLAIAITACLLAGCASSPAEPIDETPADPLPTVEVPDDLVFTGALQSVALPVTGMTTACNLENGCTEHAFTIEERLQTTLTLKSIDGTVTGATGQVFWGTDYDLALTLGGQSLAESTNPDVEDDIIEMTLEPGTYVAQITAWNDQDGSYELTIAFAAP